jgi:hypothetical protein
VQICDEREHEYKEEIVSLKTQLEEARRIEEVMNSKLKEKEVQCERLENLDIELSNAKCMSKKVEMTQGC